MNPCVSNDVARSEPAACPSWVFIFRSDVVPPEKFVAPEKPFAAPKSNVILLAGTPVGASENEIGLKPVAGEPSALERSSPLPMVLLFSSWTCTSQLPVVALLLLVKVNDSAWLPPTLSYTVRLEIVSVVAPRDRLPTNETSDVALA